MTKPQDKNTNISKLTKKLTHLRNLSNLLDNAILIPGTSYRIGIDPIIGLIPGAGDYLGTALSAYIVIQAALMGASKPTLSKMALNIILDTLVGTVPILGDFVDVTWKANTKNLELLEENLHLTQPRKTTDWLYIILLIIIIFLVLAATTALFLFLLQLIWRLINHQ
ncbi:DUF4112 domain-containing protein [Gloeothece verrucosa]|uniref:DUF4112 domain-containing protein n=1 Tax=Gloeothece verrucosa (strain PCC 7822) TaxID=497965 RepID=E0UJN8_GLOV7|nr:DUF4112 domain-containing protein [Gloeothece verrucosa]ADN12282.1 conserved hypothetical protein [Gloeothece verrucosa PCC 7822]